MLVRQLIGPYAGREFHMDHLDAVAAIKGGSVAPVNSDNLRFIGNVVPIKAAKPDVKEVAEAPYVDPISLKRKGGWPKGKPRGLRRHFGNPGSVES